MAEADTQSSTPDIDGQLAELLNLAEETAGEIAQAESELNETESPTALDEQIASTPEETIDAQITGAELDQQIAAEADSPVEAEQEPPAESPAATESVIEDGVAAEPTPEATPESEAPGPPAEVTQEQAEADQEIEDFLEAAANQPQEQEASGNESVEEGASATDESADRPARKTNAVMSLLMAIYNSATDVLARVLEAVLVRIEAPMAGLREDVKSLIGYLALGTLAMAIITWVIVLLR